MAFKSDSQRKYFFANGARFPSNEGQTFDKPTKQGFSSETKNRLMREEALISELQNARSKK